MAKSLLQKEAVTLGEDWGGAGDPSERKQLCCVAPLPWQEGPLPACTPPPPPASRAQGHQRWGQQVTLLSWGIWAELQWNPKAGAGAQRGRGPDERERGEEEQESCKEPIKAAPPSRSAQEGWGLQRGDMEELNQGCQGPPDRLRAPRWEFHHKEGAATWQTQTGCGSIAVPGLGRTVE